MKIKLSQFIDNIKYGLRLYFYSSHQKANFNLLDRHFCTRQFSSLLCLLESILVKVVQGRINLHKKKCLTMGREERKETKIGSFQFHWGQKKNNGGSYPFDFRSMQPGMRVVLATTFWLAVLVAGTVGHHPAGRLIFDQYSSPFDPHQYGVYRRAGGQADWKDQDPVEKNHPFDPSINPPRSITNTGHGTPAIRYVTPFNFVFFFFSLSLFFPCISYSFSLCVFIFVLSLCYLSSSSFFYIFRPFSFFLSFLFHSLSLLPSLCVFRPPFLYIFRPFSVRVFHCLFFVFLLCFLFFLSLFVSFVLPFFIFFVLFSSSCLNFSFCLSLFFVFPLLLSLSVSLCIFFLYFLFSLLLAV